MATVPCDNYSEAISMKVYIFADLALGPMIYIETVARRYLQLRQRRLQLLFDRLVRVVRHVLEELLQVHHECCLGVSQA